MDVTARSRAAVMMLRPVRVGTEPRHDQARAADAFDDRDDVHGEDGDPGEDEEKGEHAAEPERSEADDAGDDDVREQQDELGEGEPAAVPAMPLPPRSLLFDHEGI